MVWQIADRMRRYNVPGLGIAVIRDGQIDWSAGYGVTSEASAQAVTGSTVFQAASLSKPVAAVVALSLVTDGVLQLDEDVNQRLRSWTLERDDNAAPAPVPLRALLSHTAGVNVSGFPGFAASESLPTLLQILDGAAESPPVRITPDGIGHYSYSGGGYQVAQLLIEETTGSRFEDVARERVLGPFGMSNSTFAVELPSELSRTAASGHRHDGAPVPSGWLHYPQQAAASLWSTPTDLAHFVLGILRAYSGQSESVMSSAVARQMLTRQDEAIGLGVGLHGEGEGLHFDHAGWTRGYRSYFVAYPARGDGVVIMTNGDDGNLLIGEIVRSVAAVYGWPDFKPSSRAVATAELESLGQLAGIYRTRGVAELTLIVSAHDDHLLVRTPRGSAYTFYPSGEGTFFSIEDGSELQAVSVDDRPPELRLWGMVATREGASAGAAPE